MTYTKNKLAIENRIDYFRKIAHEKNVNVDFMDNVCRHVMENMMSATHIQELQLVLLLKGYISVIKLLFG